MTDSEESKWSLYYEIDNSTYGITQFWKSPEHHIKVEVGLGTYHENSRTYYGYCGVWTIAGWSQAVHKEYIDWEPRDVAVDILNRCIEYLDLG